MTAPSDKQRYPSLEEFRAWYNLGYERPDGIPVLHSKKRVPEFEHGEFFHLYCSENQWFESLVPHTALKPFDPVAEPPIFVHSSADDRTLELYPDFDYVTLTLIGRIQKEFLGRHPFWRVMFMSDDPSCSIVIYPEVVRFGNLPLEIDPESAMRELVPRAIAAREARLRPEREQVAFLRQRLPAVVRAIGDGPFFVVGVLDNNRGKYDLLTVLVLIRGANDHAIDISRGTLVGDEGLWSGGDLRVDASGTIINPVEDPAAVRFSVVLCHPPADYRGVLTILNQETGESGTYELKSENITRTVPTE